MPSDKKGELKRNRGRDETKRDKAKTAVTLMKVTSFITSSVVIAFLAGCNPIGSPTGSGNNTSQVDSQDFFNKTDQRQDRMMKDFGEIVTTMGNYDKSSSANIHDVIVPTLQVAVNAVVHDAKDVINTQPSDTGSDLMKWHLDLAQADLNLTKELTDNTLPQVQTESLSPADVVRLTDKMTSVYTAWKQEVDLKKKYNITDTGFGYDTQGNKH